MILTVEESAMTPAEREEFIAGLAVEQTVAVIEWNGSDRGYKVRQGTVQKLTAKMTKVNIEDTHYEPIRYFYIKTPERDPRRHFSGPGPGLLTGKGWPGTEIRPWSGRYVEVFEQDKQQWADRKAEQERKRIEAIRKRKPFEHLARWVIRQRMDAVLDALEYDDLQQIVNAMWGSITDREAWATAWAVVNQRTIQEGYAQYDQQMAEAQVT